MSISRDKLTAEIRTDMDDTFGKQEYLVLKQGGISYPYIGIPSTMPAHIINELLVIINQAAGDEV